MAHPRLTVDVMCKGIQLAEMCKIERISGEMSWALVGVSL